LDQLGPVIQREERLERFALALPDRDQVHELPVVLRRKPDALVVRDAPERRGVDRAAEVDMQLGQLIAEGMWDLTALFARGWAAHSPAAARRGRLALGMLGPDAMAIVVG